eukprot:NODE_241_length_11910_cov_1.082381.p1 type:complete len:888 gc:universal NODE_241_length_11910_cov_1.082381:6436-9099(+)
MQNEISDFLLQSIGMTENSIVESILSLKGKTKSDIHGHLQMLCFPSDKVDDAVSQIYSILNPKQQIEIKPIEKKKYIDVRLKSRQDYLKKRESKQLAFLKYKLEKKSVKDEGEKIFHEKVVSLIEDRKKLEQEISEIGQGYQMPGEYNDEEMTRALKGKTKILGISYDKIVDWEEMQLLKAAKDIDKDEDYEYLFDEDEQIAFLLASQLNGEEEEKMDVPQKHNQDIQSIRKSLPIYYFRDKIIEIIKRNKVTILVGETGSGKSTQTPQYLLESKLFTGMIAVTQPRRVACQSLADRVAKEMNVFLGKEVGYTIRFEDRTSHSTRIKFLTDGVILKEIQDDPKLSQFSVILIDEAHERTTNTDVLLGLLKEVLTLRDDLHIVIASATLDSEKFSSFFNNAPIIKIPGKTFPVDIYYTQAPEANYIAAAISTIMQIHISQPVPGDILVFLTGQEEIESCNEMLQDIIKKTGNRIKELLVYPIYASLPSEQQSKIFIETPLNARKVVLATNIAETSITIDGITYVIDCGLHKEMSFHPKSGISNLEIVPVSKAAANQRAGRAGRTRPGKCFRLYTKWAFDNELKENPTPEIMRTNLSSVVLLLKCLGVDQIETFSFLDIPPLNAIQKSVQLLIDLNALDKHQVLTAEGQKMAELPLDPRMAKVVLSSSELQCAEDICTIVALLTIQSPVFYRPRYKTEDADLNKRSFYHPNGDHMTLLNVWNQFQDSNYSREWCYEKFIHFKSLQHAKSIRDQLMRLLDKLGVALDNNIGGDNIIKAFLRGYFTNVCRLTNEGSVYKHAKDEILALIHPSSSLYLNINSELKSGQTKVFKKPKWVFYNELVLTSKEYMRMVSVIDPTWLLEATSAFSQEELDALEGTKKSYKSTGSFFD